MEGSEGKIVNLLAPPMYCIFRMQVIHLCGRSPHKTACFSEQISFAQNFRYWRLLLNLKKNKENFTGHFISQSYSSQDGHGTVFRWCSKRSNPHSFALECWWTTRSSLIPSWNRPTWSPSHQPLQDEHHPTTQGRQFHIVDREHML